MELKLISMCCKLANSDYINEQIGTELSLCKEMQADIHQGGWFFPFIIKCNIYYYI